MKFLYYIFIIFPIMYSYMCIKRPNNILNFKERLRSMGQLFKEWKKDETDPTILEEQKKHTTFLTKVIVLVLLSIGYQLWLFVGLLTFQWPLFAFLLLIGHIPLKRFRLYVVINSIISLFVLVFILLNTYHFKIDVWHIIVNEVVKLW